MKRTARRQILEEVEEFSQPPKLRQDEFTIRQFSEHTGLTYKRAAGRLKRQLDAGRLTRRKVLEDGHAKWAYRLRGDDDTG
jgi:hypothetical protein